MHSAGTVGCLPYPGLRCWRDSGTVCVFVYVLWSPLLVTKRTALLSSGSILGAVSGFTYRAQHCPVAVPCTAVVHFTDCIEIE